MFLWVSSGVVVALAAVLVVFTGLAVAMLSLSEVGLDDNGPDLASAARAVAVTLAVAVPLGWIAWWCFRAAVRSDQRRSEESEETAPPA